MYFGANQHNRNILCGLSGILRINNDLPIILDDQRKSRLPRGVVYSCISFSLGLIEVSVLYFATLTSHSFHVLFLIDQMKGCVSIIQLLRTVTPNQV